MAMNKQSVADWIKFFSEAEARARYDSAKRWGNLSDERKKEEKALWAAMVAVTVAASLEENPHELMYTLASMFFHAAC